METQINKKDLKKMGLNNQIMEIAKNMKPIKGLTPLQIIKRGV